MAGKKPQIKNVLGSFEALDTTGIVKGVRNSIVKDVAKGSAIDFGEFLGLSGSPADKNSSERSAHSESKHQEPMSQNEIVNFKKKVERTERHIEAAIDYHRDILKSGEKASKKELQKFNTQIEQIKAELISLAKSTKMLQVEVAAITVEQTSENVGVYHANFFEWMLSMIRAARERVETSEAWMSAQKNKAGKKGYWGMFKKHGTSFGLSNERAVATQVG